MLLVVKVVGEVRVQLLAVEGGWVGGWVCDKNTKLVLYSTQLKLKLKLELSLAILNTNIESNIEPNIQPIIEPTIAKLNSNFNFNFNWVEYSINLVFFSPTRPPPTHHDK